MFYLFVSVVAFKEVIRLLFAVSTRVEFAMIAVLGFSHKEIAGINFSVNSNLGIGHNDSKII